MENELGLELLRKCEQKQNLGIVIVWPVAVRNGITSRLREALGEIGTILNEFPLLVQGTGPTNLLREIHDQMEWWELFLQ